MSCLTLSNLYCYYLFQSPMDKKRLVFPPAPATVLGVLIYYLYISLAPSAVAQVMFAGTIVGYMGYDLIHYYLHHGTPFLTYFQDLKTYHVKHHFKDQQRGKNIFKALLWTVTCLSRVLVKVEFL